LFNFEQLCKLSSSDKEDLGEEEMVSSSISKVFDIFEKHKENIEEK